MRLGLFCLAAFGIAFAQGPGFAHISVDSLRAIVSYLASDELEGRATPSTGLEKAADFIRDRFRKAGLQPQPGADGYFQRAQFVEVTPGRGAEVVLRSAVGEMALTPDSVRARRALDIPKARVIALPDNLPPEGIEGQVVAAVAGRFPYDEGLDAVQALHPAAILLIGSRSLSPTPSYLEEQAARPCPVIRIVNDEALTALEDNQPLSVAIHIPRPAEKPVALRNVVGLLRGSGPGTVIVSAHYDHVGMADFGSDRVFNGANDDASGVASMVEIAGALASMPTKPKRSILFLAVFGEELGSLGSRYYVDHPLLPLRDTVAAINLEHLGRTDGFDGPRLATFSFNGPSYSNLPAMLAEAAKAEHVSVYRKPDGDTYFNRSDNYAFALAGVVSHTAMVLFEFPGYHQVDDEAPRLNYENMAAVDRALAAGIWAVANGTTPPKWNNRPETQWFRKAQAGLARPDLR